MPTKQNRTGHHAFRCFCDGLRAYGPCVLLVALLGIALPGLQRTCGQDAFVTEEQPAGDFAKHFFSKHCNACHAGSEPKGDFALKRLRTSVCFGSNLGNASSHSVKNLPVLLAGGGFKHGSHLPFDPQDSPPRCNLYVSLLQQLGIETDRFGPSTGTLTGLEATG